VKENETGDIVYREDVVASDRDAVRRIVVSSGFFSPAEVAIAVELVEERLAKGLLSGYRFFFAGHGDRTIGYTCFGPIPGTLSSYDIYWIAVHENWRGRGIGRRLLFLTEARIAGAGGRMVYADTSSQPQYAPTRHFYERCGYLRTAFLAEFFGPGDGKIIYAKDLRARPAASPEKAS
jgi:GNAT superfamily N-acetyltransferase